MLENSKHGEAGLNFSINLQGFIHDSGLKKNCFPFKCFIELYFLSWFFVKISFLLLCRLFSAVHESRAVVLKITRASNSLKDYGVLEVKCKRKWFRDFFLLGVFDFLNKYFFYFEA